VRRARVVLLSAEGVTGAEIATRLDLTPEAVSRIRTRFREGGIPGLADRPGRGRTDNKVPPADMLHRMVDGVQERRQADEIARLIAESDRRFRSEVLPAIARDDRSRSASFIGRPRKWSSKWSGSTNV
jgi:hypothetical protein